MSETVTCAVESAFHGSQIATCNVSYLLVGLTLNLPQYEYDPVVLWQLSD